MRRRSREGHIFNIMWRELLHDDTEKKDFFLEGPQKKTHADGPLSCTFPIPQYRFNKTKQHTHTPHWCVLFLRSVPSFKSRVLLRNSIGPVGADTTTTLLDVRALPKNCSCVHSICQRRPACPPPSWLRTWRARANLLVTTLNMRSGRLRMPER